MPAGSLSKKEILTVLKTLLDRGEDKIPAAVVREALAPYRSAILQSGQSTYPHIDELDQILKQFKESTSEPAPEQPPEQTLPPAETNP